MSRNIRTVAVIDDQPDARDTIAVDLEYLSFEPRPLDGPFRDISAVLASVVGQVDAAVLDHHLNQRSYAGCTGAEVASKLYDQKIPAVLITSWSEAELGKIRMYRRKIPAVLNRDEAPEAISRGFEACINEFSQQFASNRKPWQTIIRVEEIRRNEGMAYCVVPTWHPDQVVNIPLDLIPANLHTSLQPDDHLIAFVNTGALDASELFFDGIRAA